jgi:hypothetical protein
MDQKNNVENSRTRKIYITTISIFSGLDRESYKNLIKLNPTYTTHIRGSTFKKISLNVLFFFFLKKKIVSVRTITITSRATTAILSLYAIISP